MAYFDLISVSNVVKQNQILSSTMHCGIFCTEEQIFANRDHKMNTENKKKNREIQKKNPKSAVCPLCALCVS